MNLGVRWEYFSPPDETHGAISNYIPGGPGLTGFTTGAVKVVSQLFHPDRNNFAPRLGFAYMPFASSDRFVVRGGFGLQYNRPFGSIFTNNFQNTPFVATAGLCCNFDPGKIQGPPPGSNILYAFGASNSPFSYPPNPGLAFGIAPDGALCGNKACTTASPVDLFGALAHEPTPYVYTYSLEVQDELFRNLVVSLGYQGSNSRKLIRTVDMNRFIPGDTFDDKQDHVQNASANGVTCGPANPACPAPVITGNARFNRIFMPIPDVNANYNALIARATHRFSRGLQLQATYTWARSMDFWSYEIGPQEYAPFNQGLNYGPSDYDVKHNFTLSGLWDLPIFRDRKDFVGKVLGGWELNAILDKHSGFPYSVVLFGDTINDPNGDAFRPDYVGFEIPDVFVVGYGLDYNDAYRNLPYLAALEPQDITGPPAL